MNQSTFPQQINCDIFCVVIDNYGDAAVSWRLASQLAGEHGWKVRLWIDDPSPLSKLAPDFASGPVRVDTWNHANHDDADVVIEAFGCELPPDYVAAMASRSKPPVWLNLEYLSAEPWVAGCHGMTSPHPKLPLVKYFFFPGFDSATGGLLRERDYISRKNTFSASDFRAEFKLPPCAKGELTISLFAYPNPVLAVLIEAWAKASHPIRVLMPGYPDAGYSLGNLTCHPLPFLTQHRYDELLWTCDLNFVRGEDSFVRAQWAGKPLVWHIYPQDNQAHLAKLRAFLDRAYPSADPVGGEVHAFWQAWNGVGEPNWTMFSAQLPILKSHAKNWQRNLLNGPDLATRLVQFCRQRLQWRASQIQPASESLK